jgi:hypothetical protein
MGDAARPRPGHGLGHPGRGHGGRGRRRSARSCRHGSWRPSGSPGEGGRRRPRGPSAGGTLAVGARASPYAKLFTSPTVTGLSATAASGPHLALTTSLAWPCCDGHRRLRPRSDRSVRGAAMSRPGETVRWRTSFGTSCISEVELVLTDSLSQRESRSGRAGPEARLRTQPYWISHCSPGGAGK